MSDLIDAISAHGFSPPRNILWDEKIHRFPTSPQKPHSKDGWYIAFNDSSGKAAAFGSMRDAVKYTWSNGKKKTIRPEELKRIEEQREAAKKEATAARAATAIRAQRVYANASETGNSEYLTRKKIPTPDGCRFVSLLDASAFGFKMERAWHITGLIVPMRDAEGKIVNLQIIANGSDKKLFMPESKTSGVFHLLGGEVKDRVVIAEGIATAQAILPHSSCPVAVAFSAHNLPIVSRIFRDKYPTAEIIIAADGDPAGRDYSAKAIAGLGGKNRIIEAPDGKDFWDVPFPDLMTNMTRAVLIGDLITKTLEDGGQGKILPRIHNFKKILAHAEEYAGRLAFNSFAETCTLDGLPLDENAVTDLVASLEKGWIPDKVPLADVERCARSVAKTNAFHPVKDYLLSVRWDGVERIDQFFPDHLGSEESEYHRCVARSLFIGAVRRIFYPGCQADTMVVLESPQGRGKSSLWKELAGEWYLDQTASIDNVDFFIAMRGKWFVDLGELDQFQKAEITRIKQVITLRDDDYRAKYARDNERKPRQSIFVGGTNSSEWILDDTGGRRFLPVVCTVDKIDIPKLVSARDQLFAEAVYRVQNNEWPDWWNVPGAEDQQEKRMHQDSWDAPVSDFLDSWGRNAIQGYEIFTILMKKEIGQITRADEMRLGKVMKRLKWERKKTRNGSNTFWGYVRPPS